MQADREEVGVVGAEEPRQASILRPLVQLRLSGSGSLDIDVCARVARLRAYDKEPRLLATIDQIAQQWTTRRRFSHLISNLRATRQEVSGEQVRKQKASGTGGENPSSSRRSNVQPGPSSTTSCRTPTIRSWSVYNDIITRSGCRRYGAPDLSVCSRWASAAISMAR